MAKGARRAGVLLVLSSILSLSSTAVASQEPSSGQSTDGSAQTASSLTRSWKGLKAVGRLESKSLDRWPDSFAGLWLGERGKVFIAFTERGSRRVERLGRGFPKPKRLRAVTVDDSLAALRQLQGQMIADRETNPPVLRLNYDLDIDIKSNVAVAIVEQPVTQELLTAFGQRYGEDVVVRQGLLAKPDACDSRSSCKPDLRAGLATSNPAGYGCTTAFNAQIFGGDLVLSAAHCGDPDADVGTDRYHAGTRYGYVVAEQQSGRVDAELHIVNQPGFNAFQGLIYASDVKKNARVFKVGTYDTTPVGLSVCKSGITTGKTCGQVLSKTYSSGALSDGGMDFIKASYCSEPGDSGAPTYASAGGMAKVALGVHSAGATTECGDPSDYGVFGHVEFIEDAFTATITKGPPLAHPGPGD